MAFVIQLKMEVKNDRLIRFSGDLEFDNIHFMKPDARLSVCRCQEDPAAGFRDRILSGGMAQYMISVFLRQLFHMPTSVFTASVFPRF